MEEALAEARDLLRELIASTVRNGDDLPTATPATEHQHVVASERP